MMQKPMTSDTNANRKSSYPKTVKEKREEHLSRNQAIE